MKFTPIHDWIDILMTGLVIVQVLAALGFIAWLWTNDRTRRQSWRQSGRIASTQQRTRR